MTVCRTLWIAAALCCGGRLVWAETPAKTPRECMGLPLVFEEDFNVSQADRWSPADPTQWRVARDGERTVYSLFRRESRYVPKVRSAVNISVLKDVVVSDFVLDAWIRSTMTDYAHRDMVLVFGHESPTRFYYVHFGLKSDGASNTIMLVNDCPRTAIQKTRTDGTRWTEGYHHVRVVRRVATGEIAVYFDDMDKPAMTAEDRTFGWGRIGVGSFDDMGNIDRVVLWGKRVSPPTTTSKPAG